MNIAMKKVGASVIAMVFAVSAIAASSVSAASVSELQALIASLTAQIAGLSEKNSVDATTTKTTSGYVHSGVKKDFTFSVLKVGSRGEEVRALQRVLNVGADGVFGPGTKAALIKWQKANGLVADGIAGAATKAELNRKSATTTVYGKTTSSGGGNKRKDIDVDGDKLVVSGIMADDLIVGKGQKVVFSEINLTAGDEDVEIEEIDVEFSGSAHRKVIETVLLLDDAKLEIDRDGLDSDEEATLDADFTVEEGETVTVYIGALISSTVDDINDNDGLDATIRLVSITTDGADVEGDDVKGAVLDIQDNINNDEYTADIDQDDTGTVNIGEKKVRVATVNIENESDADDPETVFSIKLERTGSLGDDDLENVIIEVDGEEYEGVQDEQDEEEYTFKFGRGIELEEEGDDEDFVLYVDIDDGEGDNFAFKILDIVVLDEDDILISDSNGNGNANWKYSGVLTVDNSDVTISATDEVDSDKVASGQEDVEFVSFDVDVEGSDVEGDVEVTFKISGAEGRSINEKDIDLDNLAIYLYEDGDKDGDRVSKTEDTSFTDTDDDTTYVVEFDSVTFEADDDPIEYVIRGDINEDAPDAVRYEVTKIEYKDIEDDNNDDVDDVTENISSPAQIEVEGAVLDVTMEDADEQDVEAGADSVEVAEIKIDASNSGDDIDFTKVRLAFATSNTAITASGLEDELRNCELFNGSKSVSDQEDAESTVTFDIDDLIVEAGEEVTLTLKCDIDDNFVDNDTITITLTEYDAEGRNTDEDLDKTGISDATTVTITTGGIDVEISSDDANEDKVVRDSGDTSNDVVFANFDFQADDAELYYWYFNCYIW